MINSNELMRGNWLFYRNQANAFTLFLCGIEKEIIAY